MSGRSAHTRTKGGKKEEIDQTNMRTANWLRNPEKASENLRPAFISTAQKIIDEDTAYRQRQWEEYQATAAAYAAQSEERTESQASNANPPQPQSNIPINNYTDQAIVLNNPWANDSEYRLRCWSGNGRPVQAWNALWKDPELYDLQGDTLIHLAHNGPQKLLPSFRVHSQAISSVDYFEFLLSQSRLDSIITKNNRRSQLVNFNNYPEMAPPGGDVSDAEFANIPGADARVRHVLYLDGPGDVPPRTLWNYNLSVRNIIAMVCGKSVVGFSLRRAVEDIMRRFMQWAGTMPMDKVIEWFSAIKLHNVTNNPGLACEILLWSELPDVRWLEGWREAFIHCVGMYSLITETSAHRRLSPRTEVFLKTAHYNLRRRMQPASICLEHFDFKDCWICSEDRFSAQTSKLCCENLAAFFIRYYQKWHEQQWPPRKAEGEEFWLTRALIRTMERDFGALWRYLIDQEAGWIGPNGRSGDKIYYRGNVNFFADTPDLAFTKILIQIDHIHRLSHNPFPYPKVPMYEPGLAPAPVAGPVKPKKKGGKTLRKIQSVVFSKKASDEANKEELEEIHDKEAASISYTNASNITQIQAEFHNSLLKAFMDYETSLDPSQYNPYKARRGHWILIYGVCQVLSSISVDCPGIQFSQGVRYPLCSRMTDDRGEIFEPWQDSGIYVGEDNAQEKSFCWVLAGQLPKQNASSQPNVHQKDVHSRSTASTQSSREHGYDENQNRHPVRGATPHDHADPRSADSRYGAESSHSNRANSPFQPPHQFNDDRTNSPYVGSYPSHVEDLYAQSNSGRVNLPVPSRFPDDQSRTNSPYVGSYSNRAENLYAQSNSSHVNLPVPSRFPDSQSRAGSPYAGSYPSRAESPWGAPPSNAGRAEFLYPPSYPDNRDYANSPNIGNYSSRAEPSLGVAQSSSRRAEFQNPSSYADHHSRANKPQLGSYASRAETGWRAARSGSSRGEAQYPSSYADYPPVGPSQYDWSRVDRPESSHLGYNTSANPRPSVAARSPLDFECVPARAPAQFHSDLTAPFNPVGANIEESMESELPPPTSPSSRADSPASRAESSIIFDGNRRKLVSYHHHRDFNPEFSFLSDDAYSSRANSPSLDAPTRAESFDSNADSAQSFQTQGGVSSSYQGHSGARQAIPQSKDEKWDSDSDDDDDGIVGVRGQSYARSGTQSQSSQVSSCEDRVSRGSHRTHDDAFVNPVLPADNSRHQKEAAASFKSNAPSPPLPKGPSKSGTINAFWDRDHVSPLRLRKKVPLRTENIEPPPSFPPKSHLRGSVQRMQPSPMESQAELRDVADVSGALPGSAFSSYTDRSYQGGPVQRMQQPRQMDPRSESRGTLCAPAVASLRDQYHQGGPVEYPQQPRQMESFSAPRDIPAASVSRYPPSVARPSTSAGASYDDDEDENDVTITEDNYRAMERTHTRLPLGQFTDEAEAMFAEIDSD